MKVSSINITQFRGNFSRRPYQGADISDDKDDALDDYDPTDSDSTSLNDFLHEQDDCDIMDDDF